VANAATVAYIIEDGDAWEVGTGVYTTSGTTLTRVVTESSNADAALNLTGSAEVFIGLTAAALAALAVASLTQTQAEDAASTVFGQVSGQRLAQAMAGWDYESAETTLTASNSSTTLTHGLGATPTKFECDFICKTAENGYSVGDTLRLPGFFIDNGGGRLNGSISANSTSVVITRTGAWISPTKSGTGGTGGAVNITDSRWRMLVRASL